jgi:D-hexose-6-phosphate mutarotase
LIITNAAPDQHFSFESCLHTYFAVADIASVSVTGLKGANYLDKTDGFAQKTDNADAIRINSEVDRTYLDTAAAVEILDPKLRRKIRIEKDNSLSTVVWNPWSAKSQQMPDFGNEEFKRMLCVESGNVGKNRTVLASGRSSVLKVRLSSSTL